MKLLTVFIFATCLTAAAKTAAQQVNYKAKDATLEQALQSIKKQTGYLFIYNDRDMAQSKPVNVDLKNKAITEALDELLKDQPLTYSIKDKTISLTLKKVVPKEEIAAPPPAIKDINGKITDADGNPLAGASIKVKGGVLGTSANAEGVFVLKGVDENATIEISFVGYETLSLKVGTRTSFVVSLKAKEESLQEVVVNKGYYSEKQMFSLGDVGKVTSKDIEKQPVNNVLLALQGRIPGLFITQVNGISGGGINVRILGQNSIGTSNLPFIVVDGVPYFSQNLSTVRGGISGSPVLGQTLSVGQVGTQGNPLNYINPADIESIEVLKDADATAIYGTRAANGAILITTKKGKVGRMKVDINIQQGWSKVPHFLNLLNTTQYLEMRHEAIANDGLVPNPTSDFDLTLWDTTRNTNWQKELIGGTAHFNQYSASVSGGTANTQYLVGATYRGETSVFPGDFSNRTGSMHFNISGVSLNQKFQFQFSGNYMSGTNNLPGRDFTRDIFLAPNAPAVYNMDGTFNWAPDANGNSTWTNPVAQMYSLYDNKSNSLVGNFLMSYRILPSLSFKSSFGYTSLETNEFLGALINSVQPELHSLWAQYRSATFSFNSTKSWIIEPQLNYSENFKFGRIEALIGESIQRQINDGKVITATGQPSDQLLRDLKSATSFSSNASDISEYKYNGVFARLNYNLKEKYLVNLTARRDGSSRFGEKNKFHNFASAAVGWIFTKEQYAETSLPFLSFGKIKASYGTTGSDFISNYSYLNLYNAVNFQNPYQDVAALNSSSLPNPYLQWEETKKIQVGIDLGFMKDKITLSTTYVRNRSSNQLLQYSLPIITGAPSVSTNFPALVQNTAWEFVLGFNNIKISKNFSWEGNLNLTIPKNKLIAFPDLAKSSLSSSLIIGEALDISRTFKYYDVDPSTGLWRVLDKNGNPTSFPAFPDDATVLYSTLPKIYGGFQNSFKYKQFQLDFFVQFTKRINFNFYQTSRVPGNFGAGNGNQPTTVLDRWRKPGDITRFQPYSSDFRLYDYYNGDGFLEDISFLKLKNVSFSYQFSKAVLNKINLQNLKLFLNAQNIFTITAYKGFDPENLNMNSLPPLRTIVVGIQAGF